MVRSIPAAMLAIGCTLASSGCSNLPGASFYEASPIGARPVWTGTAPVEVVATTDNGLSLTGWYWAAASEGGPVMVFYHGRGGNRDTAALKAEPFVLAGRSVLVASYEGFGDNPGSATEAALYRDGAAFLRLARKLRPGGKVFLFGDGLGSAVALHSAIGADVAGVAAVGAFDRLSSFASPLQKRLYAGQYDNLANIGHVKAAVLLLHGEKDELIPLAMVERLRAAAAGPVYVVPLTGEAYHSVDMKYIAPTIWEAFDALGKAGRTVGPAPAAGSER